MMIKLIVLFVNEILLELIKNLTFIIKKKKITTNLANHLWDKHDIVSYNFEQFLNENKQVRKHCMI